MNQIIKRAFLLALIISCLAAVKVTADETTKKYDLKDFTGVEAGYGMKVTINQSGAYSIEVKADERDFEYLKVDKKDHTLRIYIDKNFYRKKGNIYVTINMPELTDVDFSGGTAGKLTMDVPSKSFKAEVSGGASLSGNLKCADISIELSGGSQANLTGSGKDLTLEGSGGSTFKLKNFNVNNVTADLSGGSDAFVKMNGKLNTDQSGGSMLTYYGKASRGSIDLSGGSKVDQGD